MNFAAAFGGGFVLSQALQDIEYPKFGRKKDGTHSFKLSVHVVAAAVPALGKPGTWSRTRPRLEARLNGVQKDTELADYQSDSALDAGANWAAECPWRFGDTLTFSAELKDLTGSNGLYIRVRAHKDVSIGPVQLEFTDIADLGEACVDLRQRVFPACVCDKNGKEGVPGTWQSPVLLIPLNPVHGGLFKSRGYQLNEAVGHVALVFSMDVDPESLLKVFDGETRNVAEAIGNGAKVIENSASHVLQFLERPVNMGASRSREGEAKDAGLGPLVSPDLPADGWISHMGPSGRVQWHHASLGPAPWERKAAGEKKEIQAQLPPATAKPQGLEFGPKEGEAGGKSGKGNPAPARAARVSIPRSATSFGPVVSPDLPSNGWVSHEGPNGQTYWHNKALGPAPWERRAASSA
mmetsp:Transcript_54511/g.100862  ORF Transcript_54511/g.100862 Transcript_54511/m.100862 type:complete len:408 (+) Transcript_54511:53-1276(+)